MPQNSSNYRRRSIFEDENEQPKINYPEESRVILYPVEYIEKVTSESEQWKMHVTKILDEKQKFRSERTELKNKVFDETILSSEQHEFFDSVRFNEYMRRVEMFCDRVSILAHKMQYSVINEIKEKCLVTQRKIEKEILGRQFKQST